MIIDGRHYFSVATSPIARKSCEILIKLNPIRNFSNFLIYNNRLLGGHRPFNTVGALEKAKYAVESQYAVVGVLEDLNMTLSVLENYIPRFFRGASQVYHGAYDTHI